ncbi:MAG: Outer rane stress sensor protease DegS [Firmicutes bacterium]|nr:Outer rane stress sensor protease DegS [Bacillota bacterium]
MKRVTAIAAGLLMLAAAGSTTAGTAQPGLGKLSKHDRSLLADAGAQGRQQITLLLATATGANAGLERQIAALGGQVQYRDDDLGYVRASLPVKQAESASRLGGIDAISVDEILPLVLPTPDAAADPEAVPPPDRNTPAENAYMPTRDIGAPQFRATHRTFDGRGVVIGILDTGIDLLTPELQTAIDREGDPAPKIIDWVTYTDPLADDDPTWIDMATQVTATGGRFTVSGVTYTAPRSDTYRFGIFDERDPRLGGELANDVNRDGNPAGSDGRFAVLWDTRSNRVWVDTNQDHSFADQRAMTDFHVHRDIDRFGTDDPATPVRESVPFVVQTDPKLKMVNIGIVSGSHGTHVAGIAAGKGFFGGAYDGVAPEAQIVSVRACMFVTGCTAHALLEGMNFLARDAHVDVINMSIGGLPDLNDGNNARALLYNRLIDRYKVQMFISAGNSGSGINTVGDPSVATKVMSVGAYVQKETWLRNYGAQAVKDDGLFVFSSRGPREDGGFKPDIVAPGSAVSTVPAWQDGQPVPGTYALPPGYGMFNGTSMAAPEATGGAALLISAAKQSHVQYTPDLLRLAISSSTRFLPGYAAHEQGTGLLNIPAAWAVLRQQLRPQELASVAPVHTTLSQFLATPGAGPGIYDREGWAPGQTGHRTITLTRSSGGSRAVTYNLRWVGNDGTFCSAGTIALPRGVAVPLDVTVSPATAGVHSAILQVDDPDSPGIDYQVMNTVVAANQYSEANNFAATVAGTADRPDQLSYFFAVPADTPALKLEMALATGRARIGAFHPYGVPAGLGGYVNGPGQSNLVVRDPAAGVWEVTVETSRASATAHAAFNLSTALLGAAITPAAWQVDAAVLGTAYQQSFSFTNRYGAFTGAAAGTVLGSAKTARPTIDTTAPHTYEIQVPAGSTALSARIGNAQDSGADLDLYLFDCTSGTCVQAAVSGSSSSEESVAVAAPAPGLWKVVVDPYAVPAGRTAYDYLDVFTNPALGSVTVADTPAAHAHGASWTTAASVQAGASPGAGRFLQGFVEVRGGGAVLGSAEVRLIGVGP